MSQALALTETSIPIETLASRAQGGEAGCFDEIVRRIQPRLRSFLLSRVTADQDVDDLVQETFVKAMANLSRYDSRYRFSTWLFTIASNLAVSQHRARRRHGEYVDDVHGGRAADDDQAGLSIADPAVAIADRQRGAELWRRAHEVLKPAHYRVLWLRYGEDLSVKEIAARTGNSAIHIRVLLYRVRRRLARDAAVSNHRLSSPQANPQTRPRAQLQGESS